MNTMAVREMLNAKDETGEFKIPFLVVCDAFQSEMVAFADLVLSAPVDLDLAASVTDTDGVAQRRR